MTDRADSGDARFHEPKPDWFPFERLVVVADTFDVAASNVPLDRRRDLEMTDPGTLRVLLDTLAELKVPVVHLEGPRELADAAPTLGDALVLSIYGGQGSRNRMALVPAICETFNLSAIGPDVYGRMMCQDKEVSRQLAKSCGLFVPRGRVVRQPAELDLVDDFPMPAVVKALMEGSSIGIGPANLTRDNTDARDLARRLLDELHQPVLIEEFVGGREVSYNVIEHAGGIHSTFTEIDVEGEPNYFNDNLFHAEEKLERRLKRRIRLIDDELVETDRAAANALLEIIRPYGYCRIDGKLHNGRLHFLELTPDAWIAPNGAFAGGFIERGWAYSDVIKAVLTSKR